MVTLKALEILRKIKEKMMKLVSRSTLGFNKAQKNLLAEHQRN